MVHGVGWVAETLGTWGGGGGGGGAFDPPPPPPMTRCRCTPLDISSTHPTPLTHHTSPYTSQPSNLFLSMITRRSITIGSEGCVYPYRHKPRRKHRRGRVTRIVKNDQSPHHASRDSRVSVGVSCAWRKNFVCRILFLVGGMNPCLGLICDDTYSCHSLIPHTRTTHSYHILTYVHVFAIIHSMLPLETLSQTLSKTPSQSTYLCT